MRELEEAWVRYRDSRPRWHEAAEGVRAEVQRIARTIRVSTDVSAREKDVGEFVRKALRKKYVHPWEEMTDKAGARAVVERDYQVDQLLTAIEADPGLQVVPGSVQDKRDVDPAKLEYTGVHLQVLAPERPGDTERLEVELQLRTKAQDLWSSVVSHRLLYKKDVELPRPIQRRLTRLLALMELFDEEVARVSRELPQVHGYAAQNLTTAAETAYLALHPIEGWDRGLSSDMVEIVLRALGDADLEAYPAALAAFVEERQDELQAVLDDYGPTDEDKDPYYLLFEQPEVVLVWERLVHAREGLVAAWRKSDLPLELLDRVADVFGLPIQD
jgi:ppGpp synthetase/RelA/SpoT-type nucleotidyltranferase